MYETFYMGVGLKKKKKKKNFLFFVWRGWVVECPGLKWMTIHGAFDTFEQEPLHIHMPFKWDCICQNWSVGSRSISKNSSKYVQILRFLRFLKRHWCSNSTVEFHTTYFKENDEPFHFQLDFWKSINWFSFNCEKTLRKFYFFIFLWQKSWTLTSENTWEADSARVRRRFFYSPCFLLKTFFENIERFLRKLHFF